jgi:hypothetical protein
LLTQGSHCVCPRGQGFWDETNDFKTAQFSQLGFPLSASVFIRILEYSDERPDLLDRLSEIRLLIGLR